MSRFKRCEYTIVNVEDIPWQWCYSAEELQSILNDICKGQKLERVLVGLYGYLESLRHDTNLLDLSYFGGGAYLVFENVIVDLIIHAEAMIEYRILKPSQVQLHETKDYPPSDVFSSDAYQYDLKNQFKLKYAGCCVTEVIVPKTNVYPFDLSGFDEEKATSAEKRNDLPSGIHFHLDNGVNLCLNGSDIEYFYVELRE